MISILVLSPAQSGERFPLWKFASLLVKQWQCEVRLFIQFDDGYVGSIVHITGPRVGPVTFQSAEHLQTSISAGNGQT